MGVYQFADDLVILSNCDDILLYEVFTVFFKCVGLKMSANKVYVCSCILQTLVIYAQLKC